MENIIEVNHQISRVCKMNMIIHHDGHTNIISADSYKIHIGYDATGRIDTENTNY